VWLAEKGLQVMAQWISRAVFRFEEKQSRVLTSQKEVYGLWRADCGLRLAVMLVFNARIAGW